MSKLSKFFYLGFVSVILYIAYNFVIEYSLDQTSRKFINELVKVKQNHLLKIAIHTYDWPRLYRKQEAFSDTKDIVISLLYLDNEGDSNNSIWGIRQSIKVLNGRLKKTSEQAPEFIPLLIKRISLVNRAPLEKTFTEMEQMNKDIKKALILTNSDVKAYVFIEKMLYEASAAKSIAVINQSFNDAVNTLKTGSQDNVDIHLNRFEFYHGYAMCMSGDVDGGDKMLSSFLYLNKNIENYPEQMLIDWDWALVGQLNSIKSIGYKACAENARKIHQFNKF